MSPAPNWKTLLTGPVARMLGRGVLEQLFSKMASDATLVGTIAKNVAEREDPELVWSKLSPKQRQLWQQRVETTIREVGQRLLD